MTVPGLVMLLVVTGCGSTGADGSSSTDSATSTSYYSPLEEFLNPGGAGGKGPSDQEYQAKEKQIQELVASCMADQGFEYVPFVYPMSDMPVGGQADAGSRDWVVKYGYGISTMNDATEAPSTSAEVTDPNQAIVEAMSSAQQNAYYAALYGASVSFASADAGAGPQVSVAATVGEPAPVESTTSSEAGGEASGSTVISVPEPTSAGDEKPTSLADQGCYGEASSQVYGDNGSKDPGGDQSQFQSLFDSFSALYESMTSDPKVTAAATEWVGCMSGAGYPGMTTVSDANQQANDKWAKLNGWATDGNATAGGGFASSVSTGGVETAPSSPAPAAVAEFRDYEVKIALADYDCKKSSGYDSILEKVRIELEKTFLNEHRAELEQYRTAMNGGG